MHIYQSNSTASTLQVRVKAHARIRDAKADNIRIGAEFNVRATRLTMLHDVAKRFLGDSE